MSGIAARIAIAIGALTGQPSFGLACIGIGCLALPGASPPAIAREHVALRPGFSLDALRGTAVVVLRPAVWVGAEAAGGQAGLNAEWTDEARSLLASELADRGPGLGVRFMTEPDTDADGEALGRYRALFALVAQSALDHQLRRKVRLPTWRDQPFAWTLGGGLRAVAALSGARYALFIDLHDAFGSSGRKVVQVAAAGLFGLGIAAGEHRGLAGLVELDTGNLVWLRADDAMGGDVRTAAGMRKRVSQLLDPLVRQPAGRRESAAP